MNSECFNIHISMEVDTSCNFGDFDPSLSLVIPQINSCTWDIGAMTDIIAKRWIRMWLEVDDMLKKNRGIQSVPSPQGLCILPVDNFIHGIEQELKNERFPIPHIHVKTLSDTVGEGMYVITLVVEGISYPTGSQFIRMYQWKQTNAFVDFLEKRINTYMESLYRTMGFEPEKHMDEKAEDNTDAIDAQDWAGPKLDDSELNTFATEIAELFCKYCPSTRWKDCKTYETEQFNNRMNIAQVRCLDKKLPVCVIEDDPWITAARMFTGRPAGAVFLKYITRDNHDVDNRDVQTILISEWSQYEEFCRVLSDHMKKYMRRW